MKHKNRNSDEYNFHAEICGVDLDLSVQYDASYVDNGFSHAFGYEERWEWEVDDVWDLQVMEDLKPAVACYLEDIGFPKANRKAWLRANRVLRRKIERKVATVDPESLFDIDDLIEDLSA